MRAFLIPATAVLIVAIGGISWGQHDTHGSGKSDAAALQKMVGEMLPAPSDSPSTRAFKQAHLKMMQDMHITYSGNADVDFVRGMIAHHQGAIDMANVELKFGKDPENHKLAREIIRAQNEEIGRMKAWLAKNAK
jgi:uncharacterized protein (DUF305 family)